MVAKELNKLFTGYTGRTIHHLESHTSLINKLRSGKFNDRFFVSFDAVELYPSIIIEDALDLLEIKMRIDTEWHKETDLTKLEVSSLIWTLIASPYFQCEFGFFQQAKGTPMGGPLSRLFADLIIVLK